MSCQMSSQILFGQGHIRTLVKRSGAVDRRVDDKCQVLLQQIRTTGGVV